MVERLARRSRPLRTAAFAALVAVVLLVHGCVARQVAQGLADAGAAAAMPRRIEVAYLREMAPTAPPAAAAPGRAAVAPKRAAPRRPRAPREATPPAAEPAASAPPPLLAEAAEAAAPPQLEPTAPPLAEAATGAEPASASASASAVEAAQSAIAAASAASASGAAAPFAWPASTRLRYVLTGNYRGEINGSAQVDWVRQGERYQTHIDIVVGLSFAPLLTRRMSSEGRLGENGIEPERYDEDSKVAFRDRRRLTMLFEPAWVVMPNGQRLVRWAGLQDTASQFVQMTWMFINHPELLTPGGTVDLALALPRSIDQWVYDVLAPETLHTPFGAVDAFHLRPRRVSRPGGDLTAEVWFAPSYRYLPVRIRIRQDADTFIDLVVDRPPQLE